MQSKQQLIMNQTASNEALGKIQRLCNRLTADVEAIKANTRLSPETKLSDAKAARDAALPALSVELKTARAMATVAAANEPFYQSKPLLLSLARFDPDLSKDAVIRLSVAAELKHAPLPLLGLIWENAIAEKNLPNLYQVWLAGIARREETGFAQAVSFVLSDDVVIPDQAASLAALSQCRSNLATAENLAAEAMDMRPHPVARMSAGRMANDSSRLVAAANGVGA